MLSVSEALDQILREVRAFEPATSALDDALGLVLAEDVLCDVDSPPFDKALMDGYAVISSDITSSGTELDVVEEVTAGLVPTRSLNPGDATRIMTGAPLPDGADAVVKVELTELVDDDPRLVRILTDSVLPEHNVIRKGTNKRAGESVLDSGRLLRAQELAALAEMGCHAVRVIPQPKIAVLATGDELVSVAVKPGPGQIRNSNETMLTAQIRQSGGEPLPLGIARDERADLRKHIMKGLDQDMLLLSGGVSAGKLDLVPSELATAGVEQIFHKVQVKPGKPVWFGVLKRNGHNCYVFGLPGNPVSGMVCFELFVRSAIRKLTGRKPARPDRRTARLAHSHSHKDDRETYFPAAVTPSDDGLTVSLMNWQGSSDLQSTVDANAMAAFPSVPAEYSAGDQIEVVLW